MKRVLLATILALFGVATMAMGGVASTYNGLKVSKPLSPPFITSPSSYDISHGPATLTYTVTVQNKNEGPVTLRLDFHGNHILTFKGQDVSDGQPGQAGITFGTGDYKLTKQGAYGDKQHRTVTFEGGSTTTVTFELQMTICGYFQIDLSTSVEGKPHNLSAGFTRVLGCKSSTPTPTPKPTPGVPDTGVPQVAANPYLGLEALIALFLAIGVVVAGVRVTRHRS